MKERKKTDPELVEFWNSLKAWGDVSKLAKITGKTSLTIKRAFEGTNSDQYLDNMITAYYKKREEKLNKTF
jgi:hypothetical protein